MLDLRQTDNYSKYIQLLNWHAYKLGSGNVFIRDLKLFSLAKLQRFEEVPSKQQLDEIIKQEGGVIFLYAEPKLNLHIKQYEDLGFKKIKTSSLPSKTIRFDLSKSDEELMSDMHHKTRYNIRLSERRGVKVVEGSNIEEYSVFWHKSARDRGMRFSMKKEIFNVFEAFGDNSKILWAGRDDKKLAGVLLLLTDEAIYYMYAASTSEGNKNQAPSLLVWESIQLGKKYGKKYFDFEGIYDERFPLKAWKGFSNFKKSFGGEVVKFPGSMRKISFNI